jgi:hypothetical protein
MSGWLHNMSVAPSTVVSRKPAPNQRRCRAVLFRFPLKARTSPGRILRQIDPSWKGRQAARELEERVDRCPGLDLLPLAAVTLAAGAADETCSDLLTICAVLAKSSGAVYLRAKTPNLERLREGASVILLVPKEWSPDA